MVLNSYEVINLNEEVTSFISKFKRHKVLAPTPMMAVKTLFPNSIVVTNPHGLGSIVVKDLDSIKNGDTEANCTFDIK